MRWRILILVAAVAGLLVGDGSARAQQSTPEAVKPYFLVVVDTSGSMGGCSGCAVVTNSCGQANTRLNAAKCVLGKIINSYGDIVFGMGRFKMDCANPSGPVGCITSAIGCSAGNESPDAGEMLVPIGEDNQSTMLEYVDFDRSSNCTGGCGVDTSGDPELLVNDDNFGQTPLAGSLRMARRYFMGDDPSYGTSPIEVDTEKDCRPYYVILLTDGAESCSASGVISAATALRTTPVNAVNYDVKTYVVGFGVTAGNAQIEAIADAGGTDIGYYASNEAALSLAFSQIVADAVLVEECNEEDDDCDGFIDEGFDKGTDCDGADADLCKEGETVCNDAGTGVECSDDTGDNIETCNQIDDDCDILVDEAPAVCPCSVFTDEICDGKDNDCDFKFDEDVPPQPCGVDFGICTIGQEQCIEQMTEQPTGTWTSCSGVQPGVEVCNNADDDCDDVVNGLARECYTFSTGCTLGAVSSCYGQCRTGIQTCSATDTNWSMCFGQIGPSPEICDLTDNDCDNKVDEGNPGGGIACQEECGAGLTVCMNGVITCDADMTPSTEICNNVDDDCDTKVDEGLGGESCDEDGTLCVPGVLQCLNGNFECVGGQGPKPEVCDCEDNDCDDAIDEPDTQLCPSGAICLPGPHCSCAPPCENTEFPCAEGFKCIPNGEPNAGYCIPDLCYGIDCPDSDVCVEGECTPVCDTISCADPYVCRPGDGLCVEDNCNGFPDRCTEEELCVDGVCEGDPCEDVSCDDGSFCREGECISSCAGIDCPDGERCKSGTCVADPCADIACSQFQACDPATSMCVGSRCIGMVCGAGQVCDPLTGECERDPCLGVVCPEEAQVCSDGDCYEPEDLLPPDRTPKTYVTATGGGCGCRVATQAPGGAAIVLLLLGTFVVTTRRRTKP